ncbi:Uncharacterised protein [Shewanella putrefaciens]|nr:Uncharacterised protein [Shewanella putrefaciens]
MMFNDVLKTAEITQAKILLFRTESRCSQTKGDVLIIEEGYFLVLDSAMMAKTSS